MSTQKEATIWQQLGDIIHRERVASGLSYGRMAKLSGISVRTLIHFEQGDNENGGKIGTLLAICESIGVNASDVFCRTGRAAAACGDEKPGRETLAGGSLAGWAAAGDRG